MDNFRRCIQHYAKSRFPAERSRQPGASMHLIKVPRSMVSSESMQPVDSGPFAPPTTFFLLHNLFPLPPLAISPLLQNSALLFAISLASALGNPSPPKSSRHRLLEPRRGRVASMLDSHFPHINTHRRPEPERRAPLIATRPRPRYLNAERKATDRGLPPAAVSAAHLCPPPRGRFSFSPRLRGPDVPGH